MMNQHRLDHLMKSLAENQISREEFDELIEYLRSNPNDIRLAGAMETFDNQQGRVQPLSEKQASTLYEKIKRDRRFKSHGITIRKWLAPIAASILFVIGIGYFYAYQRYFNSGQPTSLPTPIAYVEKKIPNGSRSKMEFPDGTVVWINAGSTLRYPEAYMNAPRELYLEGEAYFEVKPLAGKPFIVHTGAISTQVLGTSFNIHAYEYDAVEVTVSSGKVQVNEAHETLGLLAVNQRLEYHDNGGKVKISEVDADQYLAWHRGELILDDMDLEQAAA